MMSIREWYVYVLSCADQSFYTGITTDLQRRLKEHNSDSSRGAKYTRPRRPVAIIYWESATNRSTASKREKEIKGMKKSAKISLIQQQSTMQPNFPSSF